MALALAACAGSDNAERSTLRLPVYPSAIAMVPPPAMSDPSGVHVTEVFGANAPFDAVYDWYARHLPPGTQAVENSAHKMATFALFDDRKRSVHLEGQPSQVLIYLTGTNAPAADTVDPAISKTIALPVFPGAEPAQGGGVQEHTGARTITAAYYHTSAPLAQVEAFYAKRLPKGSLKAYIPGPDSGVANFDLTSGKARKQVTLSSDSSGTIIALVSTN